MIKNCYWNSFNEWVSLTDIIHWADTRNCQEILPKLIMRLIRATMSSIDSCIGRMLAQFPRREEVTPPEEICELIERLDSEEVCLGYRIGLQNKMGVTIRSPYAGGEIERGRVALCRGLADLQRNRFPTVAAIFEAIAQTYNEF